MAKDPQEDLAKITNLPDAERYRHFVEEAADRGTVWSLWQDGWATLSDNDGNEGLPVWPAPEFATAWKKANAPDWAVTPIDLNWLLDEMLPNIRAGVGFVVVFPTESSSIWPAPDQLEADLRTEMNLLG